jgi:hypothetical protein
MRLIKIPKPFDHPQFVFEPKMDVEDAPVDHPHESFRSAPATQSAPSLVRK